MVQIHKMYDILQILFRWLAGFGVRVKFRSKVIGLIRYVLREGLAKSLQSTEKVVSS